MREFMDYIQSAFYGATSWNRDNSYSSLNATSDALLSFPTPRGLRVSLSSLATPHFGTAYQLGTVGIVDGSISYLYSSVALHNAIAQSERIPLSDLLRSYRPLAELPKGRHDAVPLPKGWMGAARDKEILSYGRLYLPMSMLEALVVKRISPTLQVQVSAVSDQTLRNGGTVLGMIQYDEGRYGIEGLASSDGGLIGIRSLYNFGGDAESLGYPKTSSSSSTAGEEKGAILAISGTSSALSSLTNGTDQRERIYGRFSTGAELYYGTLNKSGGMSFGARFATLPSHKGTPLTATMTINPLMGNISWSYAVMAGQYCSLATRMSFNVYSYESDWALGMELWRKKAEWPPADEIPESDVTNTVAQPSAKAERSFQAKLEWRLDDPVSPTPTKLDPVLVPEPTPQEPKVEPTVNSETVPNVPQGRKERSFQAKMDWRPEDDTETGPPSVHNGSKDLDNEEEYSGVLKARLDQHLRLGLMWEGRVKSLLFSLGSGVDLRRLDSPFRTLGLEIQFSS